MPISPTDLLQVHSEVFSAIANDETCDKSSRQKALQCKQILDSGKEKVNQIVNNKITI